MRISTSASSRTIRRSLSALVKANCITKAYKIATCKEYTVTDSRRLDATPIQFIYLDCSSAWEKSGCHILDSILKDWNCVDNLFSFSTVGGRP